jgi:hypothetical protein
MAQVVEHLPSNHEAMSSKISTTKKISGLIVEWKKLTPMKHAFIYSTFIYLFIYLFIYVLLGFELRASSHSTSPFLWWIFFKIGSSGTICPGWLRTSIPLISASWVARITGVRHQCWAVHSKHSRDHLTILNILLKDSVVDTTIWKITREPCA